MYKFELDFISSTYRYKKKVLNLFIHFNANVPNSFVDFFVSKWHLKYLMIFFLQLFYLLSTTHSTLLLSRSSVHSCVFCIHLRHPIFFPHSTLLCFFKFVSRANNSKSCPPNVTQKTKTEAIDIFLEQTTLHTCGF